MLMDLLSIVTINAQQKVCIIFSEVCNKLFIFQTFNRQEVVWLSWMLYTVIKLWTDNIVSDFTQRVLNVVNEAEINNSFMNFQSSGPTAPSH